jgi:hypothetical protein
MAFVVQIAELRSDRRLSLIIDRGVHGNLKSRGGGLDQADSMACVGLPLGSQ